ncbi:EndoU domain-containing protein [Flavobacterium sp. U410]
MIGNNGFTNQKISEKTALGQLEKMHDHFDELAMGIVIGIVKATPTVTDDVILAMVFYVKNYLEEKVLGQFKNVLLKAKKLLKEAIIFVKNVITKTSEIGAQAIAMANALLCGIINGLLSLLQTILGLLAFLVGNFPLNEIEKALPKALAEHQEKLEFIEDFIDLITENIKSIFEGILNVFLNIKIWSDFFTFVKSLWKKGINTLKNTNEYFWAYVAGAIVFEVLVELVLAFFTGGTGNVAKAVAKISRAADKAKDILKQGAKIGQKIVKESTESIASIWKVLKREFEELIEAIKSGKFVSWLQKKFYQLTDDTEGLRKLYLSKWIRKFDKGFFNHIEGEFNTNLLERIMPSGFIYKDEFLVSQGGHRGSAILKGSIDVEKIIEPEGIYSMIQLADDVPFKAKISIKYKDGYLIKNANSSMFPKNWNITRIQEEVAYVYENTVVKGINIFRNNGKFDQYLFTSSDESFKILIEIDNLGNIMNAYPYL